jgi:hypothetical protein
MRGQPWWYRDVRVDFSKEALDLQEFFGGPPETRTPEPLIKGHPFIRDGILDRAGTVKSRWAPGAQITGINGQQRDIPAP